MTPIELRWWPLLAGMLCGLPATAQSEDGMAGVRAGAAAAAAAASAAPCLRAYCGDLAEPAERPAADARPAAMSRANWQRSGEREGKALAFVRGQAEDYNCLLSAAIGGELRADGYQGFKLFGQTRTLNLRGDKGEK